VISDNDIRFKSSSSFYQEAMKKIGVQVSVSVPRHPSSNGLMERENRSFVQTLRCVVQESGSRDWPSLLPFVNFVMNAQISSVTGFSPSELFQGRPPWRFECSMEPSSSPQVENWVLEQLLLQEKASARVRHLRSVAQVRKNKWRSPAKYEVGSWVLIHKSRWPQRKVDKISSPWFGPFKVVQVSFNSLTVLSSPSLGGLVKVSFSQVKHWSSVHDPHEFDSSFCAEKDGESEGVPLSVQCSESVSASSAVLQEERAGEAQQSAGDAPHQADERERSAPEQAAERDPSPRRTRATARAERSARDQAKTKAETAAQPAVLGVPGVSDPFSRSRTSRRFGFSGGFDVDGQRPEVGHSVDEGVQVARQDLQVVHGEREPEVVLPSGGGKKVKFTVEEAEQLGFYNVECILSHKFKFGSWKFLVKWEGFPVSAASWEGIKSFRLPGGKWNSVFVKYVRTMVCHRSWVLSAGRSKQTFPPEAQNPTKTKSLS